MWSVSRAALMICHVYHEIVSKRILTSVHGPTKTNGPVQTLPQLAL